MLRFLLHRALAMIGILWALLTIVFALRTVIPSNPARMMAGPGATPALIAIERSRLGLDRPLVIQYADYLRDALRGNLGMSIYTRNPVSQDLARAIPASVELLAGAVIVMAVLGLALGLLGGASVRGAGALRVVMVSGASVPTFLLGLLGLLLLYGKLHIAPAGGQVSGSIGAPTGPTGIVVLDGLLAGRLGVVRDGLWHLALPAFVLGIGPGLVIGRTLQSSLRTVSGQDYIRTARAKALSGPAVLLRHALRNALNAPLSLTGLEICGMLAGIAVVEDVFSWPGLGLYTVHAITTSDFAAIAGVTLVIGTGYIVMNAIIDIAQVAADPRLRRRAPA
jgi:peptide/nickel transport system permease protein